MTEELKNLINKIQTEGVQKAEEKAGEIAEEAKRRAEAIVEEATQKAQRIVEDAQADSKRKQASTQAALQQSGRDLILSMRKHISALLEAVISKEIGHALKPEVMSSLIVELIKSSNKKGDGDIVIALNKHDAEKLTAGLLHQLKNTIKQGLEIRPSEDIRAGFCISYDGGKSHFDFTDRELADYISTYLKPTLRDILSVDDAASDKKKP